MIQEKVSILSTWPGCAAICEELTPPREQHARLTATETASELIGDVPAMSRNRAQCHTREHYLEAKRTTRLYGHL